jgi:hypothetical protein
MAQNHGRVGAHGLVLSLLLARLMPFGLDDPIAVAMMATDRWNAGAALTAAQRPEGCRELARAALRDHGSCASNVTVTRNQPALTFKKRDSRYGSAQCIKNGTFHLEN